MWNQGWGEVCADCKHTLPEEQKYVTFAPAYPCKKIRWRFGDMIVPDMDERGETCTSYEREQS